MGRLLEREYPHGPIPLAQLCPPWRVALWICPHGQRFGQEVREFVPCPAPALDRSVEQSPHSSRILPVLNLDERAPQGSALNVQSERGETDASPPAWKHPVVVPESPPPVLDSPVGKSGDTMHRVARKGAVETEEQTWGKKLPS